MSSNNRHKFEDILAPGCIICTGCKRFFAYTATPSFSEYTPGSEYHMGCLNGHWDFDPYIHYPEEILDNLAMAGTCPDYMDKTQNKVS